VCPCRRADSTSAPAEQSRTLVRIQGTRGFDSPTYNRFALCCASRTAALATTAVILLAVVGKAAGDATEAAAGQRITTTARGRLCGLAGLAQNWFKITSLDTLVTQQGRIRLTTRHQSQSWDLPYLQGNFTTINHSR
jgi:hypothetical protein